MGTATVAEATKAPAPFLRRNLEFSRQILSDLGARFAAGELSRSTFQKLMAAEIRSSAAAAFRFELGRQPTPAEAAQLNAVLVRHNGYLAAFTAQADSLTPAQIAARAGLYSAAPLEAGAAGKMAGMPAEARVTWHGPDGGSSCPDCLALIGRSWTKDEFAALGARPGNQTCAGNCRCHIEID